MNIQDLPNEIKNKIFYYYAEHPCAKMIKEIYKEEYINDVDYGLDEDGHITLIEIREKVNAFKISESRFIIYEQGSRHQEHWNNVINLIKNRKRYREELGDHFQY